MKLAERSMSQAKRFALAGLSALFLGCSVTACEDNREIVEEATSKYDYGVDRNAIDRIDRNLPAPTIPDDTALHMTIATASLKRGVARPASRIIAVIRSNGDYPALGIYAGNNYIWRSSWDRSAAETWENKVVPGNLEKRAHTLTRDPRMHEYTDGPPGVPRLVRVTVRSMAFVVCLDDPMCGTGHCGHY